MSTTTDSRLERTMRALAKQTTQRNRFAVYSALLSARLVVPLVDGAEVPAGHLPKVTDLATNLPSEAGEEGVFVVFGEDTDLVRWRDGGGPRTRIAGTLLFPLLAEAGCVGLKINPASKVGGALYGHEVESIAEAAMRRAAQS